MISPLRVEKNMKNIKITISYDGTRYKGWQVLKNEENTIQGKLQKVLESLTGEPAEVIGSGRTDAGVHALAQTANFHISEKSLKKGYADNRLLSPDAAGVLSYLNQYLPEDIAVTSAEEVEERFHSRYSAVSKTYRYRIHVSTIPNVFERKYLYTYTDFPLDTDQMEKAAGFLCGTHDFASFCGNKHMKKSTVRTIEKINIHKENKGQEIVIDYTGDGFLQNMVRILTGTLIEVGSGRRTPDSMEELLAARDRRKAGYTAPAQGLSLLEVFY